MRAARAGSEKVLKGWPALAATVVFSVVTLIAVLPHIGVLLTSVCAPGQWYRSVIPEHFTLSHYRQAMTAADSFGAIVNSLKLSTLAMIADIFIGVTVGYLIVRTTIRGRQVLDALCMLPLAVPGLVMAFGFVAMSMNWPFGKGDPFHDWVSVISADPNPFPLLVMAYAIRRLPYIVRSTVAGLEQTSGDSRKPRSISALHACTRSAR
jgi:iron(III) transport system permease protein